jgi:hypothetical protein
MTQISAKTFYTPVLLALFDLSKGKAGQIVSHSAVYAPAARKAGMSLDAHGDTSEGKPKVTRWIQEAVKGLRKKHLMDSPAKGQWALTLPGLQRALHLRSEAAPAPQPRVQPTTSNPAPALQGHTYHPDPYIRELAVKGTPCFGGFSDRSPVCQTCPLQGACLNAVSVELSFCAELMGRGQGIPEKEPQPRQATPRAVFGEGSVDLTQARDMIVPVSGWSCKVCGKKLPEKSSAKWIQTSSSTKNTPAGRIFMHPACHERLLQ